MVVAVDPLLAPELLPEFDPPDPLDPPDAALMLHCFLHCFLQQLFLLQDFLEELFLHLLLPQALLLFLEQLFLHLLLPQPLLEPTLLLETTTELFEPDRPLERFLANASGKASGIASGAEIGSAIH